jgi:hypothetical protein
METQMQTARAVAQTAGLLNRIELPWPERAAALAIVDAQTLQLAVDERGGAKALLDLAQANNKPICDATYAAWQQALEDRRKETVPLETAIKTFDQAIIEWDRKEKRRLADEQRAIEAAAYTQQAVEQEKVVEHVEATGGTPLEVKTVAERPVVIPVAPTQVMRTAAAPPKPTGISKVRENWKGEVTDQRALVLFAIVGAKPPAEVQAWIDAHWRPELLSMLKPDLVACNSLATSTKGAMQVPGVRFWDEGSVASAPTKRGA